MRVIHVAHSVMNTGEKIVFIFLNLEKFSSPLGTRDRVVGMATNYGLEDRGVGVRVPVRSRIFSSPDRPDRILGPSNLLSKGYRGLFLRG
jgi:hypothetical protein